MLSVQNNLSQNSLSLKQFLASIKVISVNKICIDVSMLSEEQHGKFGSIYFIYKVFMGTSPLL